MFVMRHKLRKKAGAVVTDNFFHGVSIAGRAVPLANPERYGVHVTRDIPYAPELGTDGLFDLYEPFGANESTPTVLYIHGGGFRILDKETHWIMALLFARRGYRVLNINYRKAPKHKFPAAHQDAFRAFEFVVSQAPRLGIDIDKLIVAGESAGANLALSIALASTHRRPEKFAARVFDQAIVPAAIIPQCGYLQITNAERFDRVGRFVRDRLEEVAEQYLGHTDAPLADPLVLLETIEGLDRPLPPMFASVGARDVLKHDSIRLQRAVSNLGGACDTRIYDGGIHAFQAFIFRKNARQAWRDTFDFLDQNQLGFP